MKGSPVVLKKRERQKTKYLARRIAGCVAATITGVKPATLMNLTNGKSKVFDLWNEFGEDLFTGSRLGYFELKKNGKGVIVLFFSRHQLDETLSRKEIREFLGVVGYEGGSGSEETLNILRERFSSNSFPHEIGIFLGIPLKDVQAFMGIVSLPYTRTGMWKVYGEPEASFRLMGKYRKARDDVKRWLSMKKDPVRIIRETR